MSDKDYDNAILMRSDTVFVVNSLCWLIVGLCCLRIINISPTSIESIMRSFHKIISSVI